CAAAAAAAAVEASACESAAAYAVIGEPSVDAAGVELLSPRVVPLTSKWALSMPVVAPGSNDFTDSTTSTSTSTAREEGEGRSSRSFMLPSLGAAVAPSTSITRKQAEHKLEEGSEEISANQEKSSKRGGGKHCTTLVRHLGAVLGLRGKEAYRRPGPGQPVWRKRETLIQERIVQYTTLDEEGTVQELFETEKSQTEVLHMECKQTGEFAHSESTHYESGEAFNGEEGVGGRESSSRGESKRGCQEGGRREGPEHSVNSTSGPSDKDGPRRHVADGRGADATAEVRQSGGQAQAGREGEEHRKEATENFDRPDVWPDHQLFSHQTTTGRDEKDSVGFDGSGDGYEGSVVFIDKQDHQSGGEGGQGEDLAGGEESWWHPEGGSVLRGVNFSFESQKEPVVDEEEVICF
ncbi:unnamed protein product, partial [Pylaiella littoralis]